MIGIHITNCRGETFCVSNSFFPPSPLHQASQANTQWGPIKPFQSRFCVDHFLATLSDIEMQAICYQLTPRGQLNRQLLEKALLDGELKVHPELPLSDLHLSGSPASSNTAYKEHKKAAPHQTEQRSLITVRAEIKTTLRQILDQERFEAQQLEKQYQQQSSYQKSLAHIKRFATGLHSSGISFLTWLKDVHDVINMNQRLLRIIKAAMAAEDQNQGQRYQVFKQTLAESEKKELVEALGFDPSNISVDQLKHVYALANLIYEDLPTRIMLTQFVKDYADAQHSLEWSEFSGGATFEVILTALLAIATGGVGAIASLGSQARKIGQLRKLGALLTELADGLKNLPKEKSVSLRKLKEIEDKKASKAQGPSAKPASRSGPSSESEKEKFDGNVDGEDDTNREKEGAPNNAPYLSTRQSNEYANLVNSNKPWSWEDFTDGASLTIKQKRQIRADAINRGLVPDVQFKLGTKFPDFESAGLIHKVDNLPEELWKQSDYKQFKWLDSRIESGRPEGFTWHHSEVPGRMELVPFGPHNMINHNGGRSKGLWADSKR